MKRGVLALLVGAAALAAPGGAMAAQQKRPHVYRGKLEVRHSDDFRHGRGQTTWALRTSKGRRIPILPTQPTRLRSGSKIKVRGRKHGRFLQGAVRRRGSAPLHAATALGNHRVAVLLINFTSDASQPWTPAYVRQRIFDASDSTAAFYDEQSGGDVTVSGDVYGWYTLDTPTDYCPVDTWAAEARSAATDAGVDLSSYAHVMYVFPDQASCQWAGLGEVPGSQTWLNGDISVRVAAHELGHNMGLHHASSYSCTSGGAPVTLSSSCSASEYGDPFDVMGLNAYHSNGWHLEQLGVLRGTAVRTVGASGTYALRAPSAAGTAPALLRVPAGGSPQRWYDVSLRQSNGVFDSFLSNAAIVNGLSLHYDPTPSTITQSLLLDATPGSGSGFLDAALPQGGTFATPEASITASSVSAGTASVSVVMSATPDTEPPSAPTGLTAHASADGIALSWNAASDDVGVTGYRVYRDDGLAATTPSTGWIDRYLAQGSTHRYRVAAFDAGGNAALSGAVYATMPFDVGSRPPSDVRAPSVEVLTPHKGARLRHRRAVISARASDDTGVTRMELLVDGHRLAATDVAHIKRRWSLRRVRRGRHRIAVRAYDATGKRSTRVVKVRVLRRR